MIMINKTNSQVTLKVLQEFPGWGRAPAFLKNWIEKENAKIVADLGGGANPMLDCHFTKSRNITYSVMDISGVELDKAPNYCQKIQVDIMADQAEFNGSVPVSHYDLVFSHMFLEHVTDPTAAHRNILSALKPGGYAIHFFPSHWNLPLMINKFFPESITRRLVNFFQPERDVNGMTGKFPAYYILCGAPSLRNIRHFEGLGYEVVEYSGYVGHSYYARVPLVRSIEKGVRWALVGMNIPMTSCLLLILRKPLV